MSRMGVAMIKTGLYRVDQLSSSAKIRGFFGGTRRVSITLYEKLHEMKKAEEWAEKILFSYCDARGIFKRTYADRFDQFDDMAIDCLGREFPASRALTMHDIGVSDGRTACDFFQKLAARFPHLSYYAATVAAPSSSRRVESKHPNICSSFMLMARARF